MRTTRPGLSFSDPTSSTSYTHIVSALSFSCGLPLLLARQSNVCCLVRRNRRSTRWLPVDCDDEAVFQRAAQRVPPPTTVVTGNGRASSLARLSLCLPVASDGMLRRHTQQNRAERIAIRDTISVDGAAASRAPHTLVSTRGIADLRMTSLHVAAFGTGSGSQLTDCRGPAGWVQH